MKRVLSELCVMLRVTTNLTNLTNRKRRVGAHHWRIGVNADAAHRSVPDGSVSDGSRRIPRMIN
jgi:hypothetical protein